jgi:outer membrane protein OmpA-like peptidoglycan-associated protein
MSNEPNIAAGDSGEYVTLLQERLKQLGYYDGSVDGDFGPATETAVRWFQEATGLDQDGQVQEITWQALEQHESGGQESGGQEQASAETGQVLSEDGQWWWDGTEWRAVDDQQTAAPSQDQPSEGEPAQLSEDGQWQWDGAQWLAVGLGALPQPLAGPFGTADQADHPGLKSASTASALTGFETGLADLLPEHMAILDAMAADLNAHPLLGGYVTLTGGADRRGDPARNKALAQQRADVVRDYLVQRIDDEATRAEIRAYSLGEPEDGPTGDEPDLRRVDIAVTRRTIELPKPHPTDPLPTGEPYKLPERGILLGPWPTPPPFSWLPTPQRPPDPALIPQLSEWLNKSLRTDDLAKVGGDIAGNFGLNPNDVRDELHKAFQSGGEAAAKAVLKAIVDWAAGALSTPAPGPRQGPPDPIPFPTPQLQTPEIRF